MTAPLPIVFDQGHYLKLVEARGEAIRRVVTELKAPLELATALDAGCGIGFFSGILCECGLRVHGFDGRQANVDEAIRRYPEIAFQQGDIEAEAIRNVGQFDLVLCFGLLYHLENPLRAIRNLRSLTRKGLLLESMCLPDEKPWMLLRDEADQPDQSLTDLAFYASEGCLVKMLYRAGFAAVFRVGTLPDHDDFRETLDHQRRRTVLFASPAPVDLPWLCPVSEPMETSDPWAKRPLTFPERVRRFAGRPRSEKYIAVALRLRRVFPHLLVPIRLPFGAVFLAGSGLVDEALFWGGFESAETSFVARYLKPGMTVLDIGAHHGLYTLLASRRVGRAGKVVAFEPSPRERRRLSWNVRANFCFNVRIEPYAAGRGRSEQNLYVVSGEEDAFNCLRPPVVESKTQPVPVEVIPLDEAIDRIGLKRVDFLKLDVEGAELDVLNGASHILANGRRPVLLVEVYDIRTEPWGYQAREIVQLLAQRRFRWFRLEANGSLRTVESDLDRYDANLVAIPEERVSEVLKAVEDSAPK